jgi:hypothetical protein
MPAPTPSFLRKPHTSQDPQSPRRHTWSLARALHVVGVLVILLLGHATLASASTYDVSVCGTGGGAPGTSSGITVADNPGSRGFMNTQNLCAQPSPRILGLAFLPTSSFSTFNWDGDGQWSLTAPANTTLEAVTMTRTFQGFQSWFAWDLQAPDGTLLERALGSAPPNGTRTYSVNAPFVRGRFYCAVSPCGGTGTSVTVTNITPRVSDTFAPQLTSQPSGSLVAGGSMRGTKGVSFSATDLGSGIYEVGLLVDGHDKQLITPDTNGGRCVKPFTQLVPCKLSLTSSFTIDTTQIPDGEHEVQVVVYDATEEGRALSSPTTVIVHNAPTSTIRPQLAGTPKLGTQLSTSSGTWVGNPTAFSFQWLRCPSSATSPADEETCSTIPGATSPQYVAAADDAYHRDMVRVTATNASGSGSAVSAPSDLVADAHGRTAPPAPPVPSDPRDIIVVPAPTPPAPPAPQEPGPAPAPAPAPAPNTTIINNPPAAPSFVVEGLTNPLGLLVGHVRNGTNASEGARVRIAFEVRRGRGRYRLARVRSTRNRRWVVTGQLVDAQGRPIGGGQLVTAWRVAGRWSARAGLRTRSDGRFSYVLPAGPSRGLRVVYFPFSDSVAYRESNTIAELVKTPVTLAASAHTAQNKGRGVKFTGTVALDSVPAAGVLVSLEARYPGTGWRHFKLVHTDRTGHFSATYRFNRTTIPTRYSFRALAARQAGYPFEGGTSHSVEVLVTP